MPFPSPALSKTRTLSKPRHRRLCDRAGGRRRHVGWKVGATSEAVQRALGVNEPFFGPVFDDDLVDAAPGNVCKVPAHPGVKGLELEFALVMGASLPRDPSHVHTVDEVRAAVRSVAVAVEVAASRMGEVTAGEACCRLVADFGNHGGLLLGRRVDIGPPSTSEAAVMAVVEASGACTVRVNGVTTNAGDYREVMGHPLASLTWLANALNLRGLSLREGDVVSTGTTTGLTQVQVGDTVTAAIEGLGAIEALIVEGG